LEAVVSAIVRGRNLSAHAVYLLRVAGERAFRNQADFAAILTFDGIGGEAGGVRMQKCMA